MPATAAAKLYKDLLRFAFDKREPDEINSTYKCHKPLTQSTDKNLISTPLADLKKYHI